jgi:hypothetical protein
MTKFIEQEKERRPDSFTIIIVIISVTYENGAIYERYAAMMLWSLIVVLAVAVAYLEDKTRQGNSAPWIGSLGHGYVRSG